VLALDSSINALGGVFIAIAIAIAISGSVFCRFSMSKFEVRSQCLVDRFIASKVTAQTSKMFIKKKQRKCVVRAQLPFVLDILVTNLGWSDHFYFRHVKAKHDFKVLQCFTGFASSSC